MFKGQPSRIVETIFKYRQAYEILLGAELEEEKEDEDNKVNPNYVLFMLYAAKVARDMNLGEIRPHVISGVLGKFRGMVEEREKQLELKVTLLSDLIQFNTEEEDSLFFEITKRTQIKPLIKTALLKSQLDRENALWEDFKNLI